MKLGDFASDAGWPVTQDLLGIGDALGQAMRRFVENDSALFDSQMFQHAAPLAAALRKKADKEELLVGETSGSERGQHRARARDWYNGNFVPHTEGDQAVARIGDQRHARVAHQGNLGALFKLDQ